MPRLSLYKPEKGLDYKFIDRQASEMFQAGGTDIYLHKLLGSNTDAANATADQPHYETTNLTNIQDLLLLENRDRKYDPSIYKIRGIYNVQNIDFNLSQFGLFIDNDTLFMTVHINDFVKYIGRKPISGDVMELPHLRDDFALNEFDVSLPRYYVIEDVGRASEGFSSTWFPHLYRLKLKRVTDSQQFADIFNQPAKDANGDDVAGTSLRDLLSMHSQELQINDQVVAQAEADAPKSGYETKQYFTLAVDPTNGKPLLETADETTLDASVQSILVSENAHRPVKSGYTGYLLGDGIPVNGYQFGHGIQFPDNPGTNDFFLRTDYMPNRLYRYDANVTAWIAVEDAVRMNMTNNNSRSTLKTGFINNYTYTYNDVAAASNVKLIEGAFVINTSINSSLITPTSGLYLVLKYEVTQLEYVVADYTSLVSSYTYSYTNNVGIVQPSYSAVRITLPVIQGTQQTIPFSGQWSVTFYNAREEERQSLSKALRPRADL